MRICSECGQVSAVQMYHFENGRNPTKYIQCNNPKCKKKGKETGVSFMEVLKLTSNK